MSGRLHLHVLHVSPASLWNLRLGTETKNVMDGLVLVWLIGHVKRARDIQNPHE